MTFRSNARISSPKHAKFALFLEQREYSFPNESFAIFLILVVEWTI
jgi:hypothetical protein